MPERNVAAKFLAESDLKRIHAEWWLHKELAADQAIAGVKFTFMVESLLGHIAALERDRESVVSQQTTHTRVDSREPRD